MPALSSTFLRQSPTSRSSLSFEEYMKEIWSVSQKIKSLKSVSFGQRITNVIRTMQFIAHLLFDLLLDLFEAGSQVHRDLVFGSQQSLKHSISRHAYLPQSWLLELALQVNNFDIQVLDLESVNESHQYKNYKTKYKFDWIKI